MLFGWCGWCWLVWLVLAGVAGKAGVADVAGVGCMQGVLFRLHREMHMALSLLPRRTQQLRETGETEEN